MLAFALSLLFNFSLLVLSPSNPGATPSKFWRVVNFVSKPAIIVASSFSPMGHSPLRMVALGIICSIVYYGLLCWIVLTVLSSIGRRRRAESTPRVNRAGLRALRWAKEGKMGRCKILRKLPILLPPLHVQSPPEVNDEMKRQCELGNEAACN